MRSQVLYRAQHVSHVAAGITTQEYAPVLPHTANGMHNTSQQETNSYGNNHHAVGATPPEHPEGASTYRMGGMEQSNGYSPAQHNVHEADSGSGYPGGASSYRTGGLQQSNGYNHHAGVADWHPALLVLLLDCFCLSHHSSFCQKLTLHKWLAIGFERLASASSDGFQDHVPLSMAYVCGVCTYRMSEACWKRRSVCRRVWRGTGRVWQWRRGWAAGKRWLGARQQNMEPAVKRDLNLKVLIPHMRYSETCMLSWWRATILLICASCVLAVGDLWSVMHWSYPYFAPVLFRLVNHLVPKEILIWIVTALARLGQFMWLAEDGNPLPLPPVACVTTFLELPMWLLQTRVTSQHIFFAWSTKPCFGLHKSTEEKSEYDMYGMLPHLGMTMYGIDPGDEQLSLCQQI